MELKLLKGMRRGRLFRVLAVLVFLMLFTAKNFGQSVISNDSETPIKSIMQPRVADLMKQASTPTISYTGNYNYNIPLHIIVQNDIADNLTLNYNSTGFFPNKRDGEVGVNWSINCGGMISRIVNGVPDENAGLPTMSGAPARGTYYGGFNLPSNTNFNDLNTKLFNLDGSVIYPVGVEFGGRFKMPSSANNTNQEMKSDTFILILVTLVVNFILILKGNLLLLPIIMKK